MKRVNRLRLLACALCVSLAGTSAFSGVAVTNVAITLSPNLKYYTGGTTRQLGFTSAVATGDLQSVATPVAGTYDYQILNASLVFQADSLVTDQSAAGIAKGQFAGGGTITLTGDLKNKATNTIVYSNQVLLTANMTIPSSQTWALQEQASYVMGSVYFDPSGGVLYTGSLLNIGQFRLALSALPTINPTSFAADQKSLVTRVELVAAPEPATLAFIAIGTILLRKRIA